MSKIHLCEDYSFKDGAMKLLPNAETRCGVLVRKTTHVTSDVISVTCDACVDAESCDYKLEADMLEAGMQG